ncbi:hypothetical protein PHAVU_010G052800 [Phaseolus vulgaris]|uniref:Uncharacterized protein n=1 Tax=Phaseolus vulgaris TaxID=3885 RepID=V7AQK6_PHAVU|nr:hypothetical protein PHAVU_010G052800g [Phaseolus vulgaris]ESW06496.1 hypothetical protein PHAVU_010G052800g [Phaseolus vulgaris]
MRGSVRWREELAVVYNNESLVMVLNPGVAQEGSERSIRRWTEMSMELLGIGVVFRGMSIGVGARCTVDGRVGGFSVVLEMVQELLEWRGHDGQIVADASCKSKEVTKASKDHVEELVIEDYLIPLNPVHHAKLQKEQEMKRKGGESEEIEDQTWVREACVDYKGRVPLRAATDLLFVRFV